MSDSNTSKLIYPDRTGEVNTVGLSNNILIINIFFIKNLGFSGIIKKPANQAGSKWAQNLSMYLIYST
ncbi:hypothetical protein ACFLS7_05675, partial [Bacteroidota bacterium]